MAKLSLEDYRKMTYYRGALWACYSDIRGCSPEAGAMVLAAFNELNRHIEFTFRVTTLRGDNAGQLKLNTPPPSAAR
jgi:hypothetical protein